jgi:hypothetical protein
MEGPAVRGITEACWEKEFGLSASFNDVAFFVQILKFIIFGKYRKSVIFLYLHSQSTTDDTPGI